MINLKKIRKTNQKKKKLTLLGIIILIITATATCTFLFLSSPKLEIEKSTLTFSYDEEVILPKYRAYAMNKDISNKVKIKNYNFKLFILMLIVHVGTFVSIISFFK